MTRRTPLPPKNLTNMPDAIQASAWGSLANNSWTGAFFRGVDTAADWLLKWVKVLSLSWAFIFSVGTLLPLGVLGSTGEPKGTLPFQIYFAFVAIFCGVTHGLKLILLTPRADPEYPLIDDIDDWRGQVRIVAACACICAACVWLWACVGAA